MVAFAVFQSLFPPKKKAFLWTRRNLFWHWYNSTKSRRHVLLVFRSLFSSFRHFFWFVIWLGSSVCNFILFIFVNVKEQSTSRVMVLVMPRFWSAPRLLCCENMHVIFVLSWFCYYDLKMNFIHSPVDIDSSWKYETKNRSRTQLIHIYCCEYSYCITASCVWLQFVCVWPISTILMMRE